jgi:hypothetical protein
VRSDHRPRPVIAFMSDSNVALDYSVQVFVLALEDEANG